ncbi:MAG: molybdopterin-dependent oxidoreductase [Acidimicrobiales bacterium]
MVALAAGELVGGLDRMTPSLLVSLGQAVIDRAPPRAKDLAIETFGTADKPVLVAAMAAVALLIGAAIGRVARRRPWVPLVAYLAGGVLLTWPALTRTTGRPAVALAAGVATVAAGLAALWLAVAVPLPNPAGTGGEVPDDEADSRGRRATLRAIGQGAAVMVLAGGTGRFLARFTSRGAPDVALPAPSAPLGQPASATSFTDIAGLTPLFTPNSRFYRIDTALVVPRVDLTSWRLRIGGLVDRPFELTFDELVALSDTEADVTLSCVSNEVGGSLAGSARWQGVALATLLEQAGARPEGTQIVGRSIDGWTGGFPTALASDGRPALVAVGMNGEGLPFAHGFPARLVVGGLYGYVSATKWLEEIELTTLEGFDGYWVPRGWDKLGPVEIQSRIDTPRYGAELSRGRQTLAGMAGAPPAGVQAVEVAVDGGPWEPAVLAGELTPYLWRQWRYDWDATPGRHRITVRAIDAAGRVQTDNRRRPRPGGATGHHEIVVQVR